MANNVHRSVINDATAWKRDDVINDKSWIYHLDEKDIDELERACRYVSAKGMKWGEFSKKDFPLDKLGKKLSRIDDQIRSGRGFSLVKGLPIDRYSMDDLKTLYWGIGVHLGTIISHNTAGDCIAPVTDLALKGSDPNRRNNTTNQHLDPHTDLADVVALLCVEKAMQGGVSSLSSSVAIHNEIVEMHPEYLEVLYEGFYHDYRGYGPSGDPNEVTPTPIPVFEYNNGRINCAFARKVIETGAKKRGVPLTPLQKEAVDYVHEAALRDDMRVDMMLEPGDIQIINNYITLHSRTHYIDYEDERKRYLLRMWINLPDNVQLSSGFASFVRRGIPGKGEVSTS